MASSIDIIMTVGFGNMIQWQYEGTNIGTSGTVNKVNFVGAGVVLSRVGNTLTVSIAGASGASDSITDWNLNLDAFPSGSTRGRRYIAINGPSVNLKDRQNQLIYAGTIATSLEDNASPTDNTKWALQQTIMGG